MKKGVVIELDFAAVGGAELSFHTAERFLRVLDSIPFDESAEAKYFAGADYASALAEYFRSAVKTKKTAPKAARDLAKAFRDAITVALPTEIDQGARNFVKTLDDAGVKVALMTRADCTSAEVSETIASMLSDNVTLVRDDSATYGFSPGVAWLRAAAALGLGRASVEAVAGSGFGVKAALAAGIGAVAVVDRRVAYQDFTGADGIFSELSSATAKKLLETIRK